MRVCVCVLCSRVFGGVRGGPRSATGRVAEASTPRVALLGVDYNIWMTDTAVRTKAACDTLPLQCCVTEVEVKTQGNVRKEGNII